MQPSRPVRETAREKLLDAAITLVRQKGFAATSVDDLCKAAGVTKGAFFHHFVSKEALGAAAARHWTQTTGALFAAADYHQHADPLDRFLGYLDLRAALAAGDLATFTCYAGTSLQECYDSSAPIRQAASDCITFHADLLAVDIDAAIARHGAPPGITGRSLALHTQATLQGAFILAKGEGSAAPVHEAIDHLRRYVLMLFNRGGRS